MACFREGGQIVLGKGRTWLDGVFEGSGAGCFREGQNLGLMACFREGGQSVLGKGRTWA